MERTTLPLPMRRASKLRRCEYRTRTKFSLAPAAFRQAVTPDVQLLSTNTRAVHRLRTASLCAGQVPEQSIGGPRSRTDTCVLTHVYLHIAIRTRPAHATGRTHNRPTHLWADPSDCSVYARLPCGLTSHDHRASSCRFASRESLGSWALVPRGFSFDAGSFDPDLGELPRLDDVAVLWRCGGCR